MVLTFFLLSDTLYILASIHRWLRVQCEALLYSVDWERGRITEITLNNLYLG